MVCVGLICSFFSIASITSEKKKKNEMGVHSGDVNERAYGIRNLLECFDKVGPVVSDDLSHLALDAILLKNVAHL